jgi:perosamine synthetase
LRILEDAAEAVGAEYYGKRVGNLSDAAAFSFFANKNLTTGEGGMVVTDDQKLYDKVRYFKNVCFKLNGLRDYIHEDIGFNYRMSNLHAAIGLAQVEKAEDYKRARIGHGKLYRALLAEVPGVYFQKEFPEREYRNVYWMNGFYINPSEYGSTRDQLIFRLQENGIDYRTFFVGMHRQPALLKYGCDCSGEYPVTDNLTRNGLYVPSGSNLTEVQIQRICSVITKRK